MRFLVSASLASLWLYLTSVHAQVPYTLPPGQALETRTSAQVSTFTIGGLWLEGALFLYGNVRDSNNLTFITGLRLFPGLHDLASSASAAYEANGHGMVTDCRIFYDDSIRYLGWQVYNQLQGQFGYNCQIQFYPTERAYNGTNGPLPFDRVRKVRFDARMLPQFQINADVDYDWSNANF